MRPRDLPSQPPGTPRPGADAAWSEAAPAASPRPVSSRSRTTSWAALATALLLAALSFFPAAYVVHSPGPTFDTLGTTVGADGKGERDVVEVSGARTYPASGQLRLTTVLQAGGPGQGLTPETVLRGWFASDTAVLPVRSLYPEGTTRQEEQQQSAQEMTSSQENATYAALDQLGYDIPTTVTVAGVVPGSGADGRLREKDVITSLDGKKLGYADLLRTLRAVTPGDTVQLGVRRGDKDLTVAVPTSDGGGRAVVGVLLDPTFDFPVDVRINLADVGGPSAGTMFALAIMDRLTPDDEAAGQVIAGTGTMDVLGDVGAIGGIQQKLAGARRDGATWFLAPVANCGDVVGHVPDGLSVAAVSTLAEAHAAVVAIGKGATGDLPTCNSP